MTAQHDTPGTSPYRGWQSTRWIDASFLRGGTSKGIFFTDADLPLELPDDLDGAIARQRDAVLCGVLGSPDQFGRQLDGMGGGVSSLSKAMIVGRSTRPGIDLDYTFAQVPVDGTTVDYSGNCGNLSSGVVPFALAAGLVHRDDGLQRFSLYNLNTGKSVDVRLQVEGGRASVRGDFALPGVSGAGSPIDLVYPTPGGSRTVGVLPTGSPADVLRVGDGAAADGGAGGGSGVAASAVVGAGAGAGAVGAVGAAGVTGVGSGAEAGVVAGAGGPGADVREGRDVRASIVDAAIPLVLVPAAEFGLTGAETPAEIEALPGLMRTLEAVRREGAVRAGLCADTASAPHAVPKIVLIAPPRESVLLDGSIQRADAADVLARTLSMERAHGAVPGTGAMCLAAAACIPGTVVHEAVQTGVGVGVGVGVGAAGAAGAGAGVTGATGEPASLRIGTPSGVVTASAVLATEDGTKAPHIAETALARTARILMRGEVAVEL